MSGTGVDLRKLFPDGRKPRVRSDAESSMPDPVGVEPLVPPKLAIPPDPAEVRREEYRKMAEDERRKAAEKNAPSVVSGRGIRFPESDKEMIRKWKRLHPNLSQARLAAKYHEETGRTISEMTIGAILRDKPNADSPAEPIAPKPVPKAPRAVPTPNVEAKAIVSPKAIAALSIELSAEAELRAMKLIDEALDGLEASAIPRVLRWAFDRRGLAYSLQETS